MNESDRFLASLFIGGVLGLIVAFLLLNFWLLDLWMGV